MMIQYEKIVSDGLRQGADEVELYIHKEKTTRISGSKSTIGAVSTADVNGVGIRVFRDNRLGFAQTSVLTEDGVRKALAEALDVALAGDPDEFNGLPDMAGSSSGWEYYDDQVVTMEPQAKLKLLAGLHDHARAVDSRVSGLTELLYKDQAIEVRIVNSKGVDITKRSTAAQAFVEVCTDVGGDLQSGYGLRCARKVTDLDFPGLVEYAAGKSLKLLGGKPISSREAAVIFEPLTACELLGVLSFALGADAVQQGRSMFVNKVGEQVGSDQLTITDDPEYEAGERSQPFDGEGVASVRREIISAGRLTSLFHDASTARKAGCALTGHGNRGNYRSLPLPMPSNLRIMPGQYAQEELMRMAGNGLLVLQVFGLTTGGADQVSGHLSVGVSGVWFEHGEPVQSVREVTVSGSLFDLLNRVQATGNDVLDIMHQGCWSAPSVLIERLMISGK